jgi:pseudouridine synthase
LVATGVSTRSTPLSRRAAARLIDAKMVQILPKSKKHSGRSSSGSGVEEWVQPDGPGMRVDPLLVGVRVDRAALRAELAGTPVRPDGEVAVAGSGGGSTQVLAPASMLPAAPQLMLHYKRRGVLVSRRDEKDRDCLFDILHTAGVPEPLFACGRLDYNTEGLLLLTNSGPFANYITHPSTRLKRVYRVRISGNFSAEKQKALERGLLVDIPAKKGAKGTEGGRPVRFSPIRVITGDRTSGNNFWIELHLSEGRNRQIRLSMEQLRLQVSRIIRIGFGPYSIENLVPGEVREVAIKSPLQQFAEAVGPDASVADVRKLARRVYRRGGIS